MALNLFSDDVTPGIAPALGLEMYHNFTLLHDDVMDNASERRGRPTVHLKWDPNSAILSGDAMQGLAYRLIAEAPLNVLKQVIDLFTDTNLEIGAGQQLDMEFETRNDVTTEEYLTMIRLKTSVLFLYTSTPRNFVASRPTTKDSTATLMLIPAISPNREKKG